MNEAKRTVWARWQAYRRALERGGRRGAMPGMTLIEIMVVVAIIGLIAVAVVVAVLPRFRQAQGKTAEILVRKVQAAAVEYYIQNGQCPGSVSDLKDYGINNESQKDPWGNELQVSCDGANDLVEVRSAGKDGSPGSEDDIFYNGGDEEKQ